MAAKEAAASCDEGWGAKGVVARQALVSPNGAPSPWRGLRGSCDRWIANKSSVWYNGDGVCFPGTTVGERRTTVEDKIGIQQWMVLAFLFYLDIVVLGCLFLIAMNKIYLLP